jgi:hypothetical protein
MKNSTVGPGSIAPDATTKATNGGTMAARNVSGWTVGFAVFAGVILMLVGVFHALAGLAAIIDDKYFVVTSNYAYEFDTTAWGWIHLIYGVIVIAAGYGIFNGATWARLVGIVLASISAIGNFFFIPYQPVWAVLIIALDVLVIAALTAYGPEEAGVR